MKLRWYQTEAVEAAWSCIRTTAGSPCIELPTGAGKSLVISQLAIDTIGWGGRAIILAHRKELLQQTADKIRRMSPDMDLGVYSAGLKSRDTRSRCLVAGIQSVHGRAGELGRADVIIVDEAHLIPPDGDGMYQRFLSDARIVNPNCRLIGLTATPYRMKEGYVCGSDNLLNTLCYRVGVQRLIAEGFLCDLVSNAPGPEVATDDVGKRGGEWIASALDQAASEDIDTIYAACKSIIEATNDRHSIIIFTCGREHGKLVTQCLEEIDDDKRPTAYLDGTTESAERADILGDFADRRIVRLVNIDVLTTGFDAPGIDAVCLLRPTLSPGMYCQMVGRGLRRSDGKQNCLVLDFGGNVARHGPINAIAVGPRDSGGGDGQPRAKRCDRCGTLAVVQASTCGECGAPFTSDEDLSVKHDETPSDAPILEQIVVHDVLNVSYRDHEKRHHPHAPHTMRVTYETLEGEKVQEWICIEHAGYAGAKAVKWWDERAGVDCPETAADAVFLADQGVLATPTTISTLTDGKYLRIVNYELGDIPAVETMADVDDLPF